MCGAAAGRSSRNPESVAEVLGTTESTADLPHLDDYARHVVDGVETFGECFNSRQDPPLQFVAAFVSMISDDFDQPLLAEELFLWILRLGYSIAVYHQDMMSMATDS